MKKSMIYLDNENRQNAIDLLEVLRQVYEEEPYETYGVSINDPCHEVDGLFDVVVHVADEALATYDARAITAILGEIQQHYDFDCILVPATNFGRMLAPRLAMHLKVGLVADVTEINNEKGVLEMVRPAFSGKIMAGITKEGEGPVMMSIRQNVFSYSGNQNKRTKHLVHKTQIKSNRGIKLIGTTEKAQTYDIRESDILVSGGGGILREFGYLDKLAKVLNGQVSASRRIVDKGIASRSIQVGQSGKTVSPKLYIALGIYGAIQHIEGLKNVKHIISVNTNKNAPICSLSHLVVEGDALEFIERLVKKIENSKKK